MKITWWGHATATVELGGTRVLTDPVLTRRVAHLSRQCPTPPAQAAEADVVVISHLHADHLHLPSLRKLPAHTRLVASRGVRGLLARRDAELAERVEEVAAGDTVRVGDLEITATAAKHDGRRLPGSRFTAPALGFLIGGAGERVWFAGDTGLFDGMHDLGTVDVALVPVGGWGPTLGPEHLDPEQAVEAVRRTGARHAIPVHYGTFWPSGLRTVAPGVFTEKCRRPGQRFEQALHAGDVDAHAHVVAPGGSVAIPVTRP